MDDIKIIVERLDKARKQLKLKHKDLAQILELNTSSVSSAFSRKSMKISKIKLLAAELNINLDWLLYGKGEVFGNGRVAETELEYTLQKSKSELINLVIHQQKLLKTSEELLKAKDKLIDQLNDVIDAYKK